jgi:hypothetical protein
MPVNEPMPQHLVSEIKRRHPDLAERTVGILGMAFKPEVDDPRASLRYKLKTILKLEARAVLTSDPYVRDPELCPASDLAAADLDRRRDPPSGLRRSRLRKIGGDVPFRWTSDRPFPCDVQWREPDGSKAERLLGFQAETTLDEVIPWVREQIEHGSI